MTVMPEDTVGELVRSLLAQREPGGGWHGHLSDSALATAISATALHLYSPEENIKSVASAVQWLEAHTNSDGGWGDTPDSPSNMATTLLSWAALRLLGGDTVVINDAGEWLSSKLGSTQPDAMVDAILDHYGRDRTFSVPILVMGAVCGVLGGNVWHRIPRLPFEIAILPRILFRWLRLPVVSYALPALISMGLCVRAGRRGKRSNSAGPITRLVLKRLISMQPVNGGFLEATPLTGFVVMSLISAGMRDCVAVRKGVGFLKELQRCDGGWPIDSELSTWVTTLSVKALHAAGEDLQDNTREEITSWLVNQQFSGLHPFTGAKPGGWGWCPLPGSVPDADDTAGALIALKRLDAHDVLPSIRQGICWLLELQNRDGGMPTFCRGWGKLPFDRSCADLTAHSIFAWMLWLPHLPGLERRILSSVKRALDWLGGVQREDGSWVPLWFGNQHTLTHENPVYGTAVVVRYLSDTLLECGDKLPPELRDQISALVSRGRTKLCASQCDSGGWGGDSGVSATIEEPALAVSALSDGTGNYEKYAGAGYKWLLRHTAHPMPSAAIGLYFASLWYHERLYSHIMSVDAMGRVVSGSPISRRA